MSRADAIFSTLPIVVILAAVAVVTGRTEPPWQATNDLRWYDLRGTRDSNGWQLQQRYVRGGEERWQNVQLVRETD